MWLAGAKKMCEMCCQVFSGPSWQTLVRKEDFAGKWSAKNEGSLKWLNLLLPQNQTIVDLNWF